MGQQKKTERQTRDNSIGSVLPSYLSVVEVHDPDTVNPGSEPAGSVGLETQSLQSGARNEANAKQSATQSLQSSPSFTKDGRMIQLEMLHRRFNGPVP